MLNIKPHLSQWEMLMKGVRLKPHSCRASTSQLRTCSRSLSSLEIHYSTALPLTISHIFLNIHGFRTLIGRGTLLLKIHLAQAWISMDAASPHATVSLHFSLEQWLTPCSAAVQGNATEFSSSISLYSPDLDGQATLLGETPRSAQISQGEALKTGFPSVERLF